MQMCSTICTIPYFSKYFHNSECRTCQGCSYAL